MRKNVFKKMTAFLLVLLMLLTAFPAFAAQAASKKVSVYVISEIIEKDDYGDTVYKMSYNKKGLLKTQKQSGDKISYVYYKKRLMQKVYKSKTDSGTEIDTRTAIYDKKGNMVRVISVDSNGKISTHKYYYKNGKKVKAIDGSTKAVWTYKYDKKGRLKELKADNDGTTMKSSFKYNKKNDPIKISTVYKDGKETAKYYNTFKYTYKKNRRSSIKSTLVFPEYKEYNSSQTIKYKYKKIEVPKSYVKTVKEQQKELKNDVGALTFLLY